MADKAVSEEASMDGQAPKPTSIPVTDNTVWADASPLLDAACIGLRYGELIHGDNFNLFAAMSALEIMDPKMDSGIVCRYYSIDEAIENGAAPVPISLDSTIDVQCTIDIMDHLLACEEEDLFTMTYGLPLNGDGDEKCLSMLNAVEETISRQLRACKATSSKRRVSEDLEPLQYNPNLEEGFCKALLCRLRFRKHFFHVLTCMKRPQGRGLELARKHIASCISELEFILKSAEFLQSCSGESCEDDIDDKTTASGREPIGFDASLNSRLSAPTPPRAIKILSWKKAVEYFVKLLHDLDVICSYSLDPHLENLLRFVVQFQKSQPDLVARSHLQLLLVQDGKLYGRDPIFAVITKAAALPEATKNHDIQKNESILQLGQCYYILQLVMNLLKILCTNAAWQRRKLGKILQDWRVIYLQLELALRNEFGEVSSSSNDENICMKIFQHILIWVEEQTYWIACRFLMLGFELELYSASEYCMVYWYSYAVLIKLAEKTHLKMAVSYDTAKRKGKKKRDSPKDLVRESRIPPAVLFLQCYICLAEGLTMMLAALRNEFMILQSPSPFNTEQEKFVQHFELLQRACIPDHASYLSFKESTTHARFSTLVMYNYFKDAQRIAKEVKSSFSNDPDRLAELRKLEQVAEHNSVALNLICRLGALDPSLKVSFEFSHHPFFATAVVRRS
ncbi:N-alpha-acetyltransferase 35, NatC auxiliary subunit-like isoform X5 [Durio zibethinus]|uniref:N-alpha-acetyltransferase 35, NatC auxiliary subunit-like isoform X5 n=1 Tax=Durio zibethinus TaxID=66656 RepID=A0A6P5ZQN6_DURZI|nr:N-alpha-acetyltransferase 35, NatC auxiliary subunit-like isoform X5 [Durio zibethinus]